MAFENFDNRDEYTIEESDIRIDYLVYTAFEELYNAVMSNNCDAIEDAMLNAQYVMSILYELRNREK